MMATLSRSELKTHCLEALDRVAVEHPAGHQDVYAARYLLRSHSGEKIELMFEKGPKSAANLWIDARFAAPLFESDILWRAYPAGAVEVGTECKRRYGRHSALKAMRGLRTKDLVRFTIERATQVDQIIAALVGERPQSATLQP